MKFPKFLSFKVFLLIVVQFLRRNKIWVVIGLASVIFLIFAQQTFGIFKPKQILREGMVGTYQEHDLPAEVTELISDGLVEMDEAGRIKAKLAAGWEINNDSTIFKFKLKDDLRWVDGSVINSRDLAFNIADTEVTYPDDKTIQFKLKEAYSPFPSLLTKPVFKKGTLLGTGPYKITQIEKSRIFITKINLEPMVVNLPKIIIRFYPNEKVAITGFNMGEVQSLLGLSNTRIFTNNPQTKSRQETDFSKMVTIIYNTKDPTLSNRSIRQALSYQAPKIEGEEEANSPYPPSSWVYNQDAKKYLANGEEAEAALERAKENLSADKLKEELILTTTPNLEDVGKLIMEAWRGLSFNIKLRVESGIPQNFQALLITQSIPKDPDQYYLWHSTQEKTNLAKYSSACCPSSARVDKDLEDGRKATSEEERRDKYQDFQKTLMEDAPATFLYFPKYNVVYLKKIEGLLNKVLKLQLGN